MIIAKSNGDSKIPDHDRGFFRTEGSGVEPRSERSRQCIRLWPEPSGNTLLAHPCSPIIAKVSNNKNSPPEADCFYDSSEECGSTV